MPVSCIPNLDVLTFAQLSNVSTTVTTAHGLILWWFVCSRNSVSFYLFPPISGFVKLRRLWVVCLIRKGIHTGQVISQSIKQSMNIDLFLSLYHWYLPCSHPHLYLWKRSFVHSTQAKCDALDTPRRARSGPIGRNRTALSLHPLIIPLLMTSLSAVIHINLNKVLSS